MNTGTFSWRGSLLLVVLFSVNAIPLIILLYFLLSLVFQKKLAG